MAITSNVRSSVYSPSTKANEPSVNRPSLGWSWERSAHNARSGGVALPFLRSPILRCHQHPPRITALLSSVQACPEEETVLQAFLAVVWWILTVQVSQASISCIVVLRHSQ